MNALDAALQSRWAHEQGPNGLVQLVTDAINAMKEVRVWLEYGDYLAIHCEALNQGGMRDLLWKTTEGWNWQEVARRLEIEENAIHHHSCNAESPMPSTRWMIDTREYIALITGDA